MRRLRHASLLLVLLLLVFVPLAALASAEETGHAEAADPFKTLWDMGVKFLNFAILLFVLIRFLGKPLASYLAARAAAIRAGLAEREERQAAAAREKAAWDDRLASVDREIARVREEARLEMERERETLLEEARRAAQQIADHAQETVQQEFAKARAELHREAVDLSLGMAEKLIRADIGQQDQQRFAEEYLGRIGSRP